MLANSKKFKLKFFLKVLQCYSKEQFSDIEQLSKKEIFNFESDFSSAG